MATSKTNKQKYRGGRKGKYLDWITPEGLTKLEGWTRNGDTDQIVADRIGINVGTLYEWKNRYPEINEALKRGKEVIDLEVENKLFKRAMGYEVEEEKTYISESGGVITKRKEITKKHIPPDTTAQIFWLKNRRPEFWRDRQDMNISSDDPVSVVIDYGDE